MFKLLLLFLGIGAGAGGATAFYLSEPKDWTPETGAQATGGRVQDVKARFLDAISEGKRQGAETENRMRQQLDAYRKR